MRSARETASEKLGGLRDGYRERTIFYMRLPLRFQVFLPFAGLLSATILAVGAAWAGQALRTTDEEIRRQMRSAAGVLVAANFPLTDAVLEQTRGLSGAEFIGVDASGAIVASSLALGDAGHGAPAAVAPADDGTITLDGVDYVHQAVERSARGAPDGITRIHILYPQRLRRELMWRALGPSAVIGGSALVVAAALSYWVAARVSRPIDRVREQFRRLADGDAATLSLPPRDDELRDLVVAVNTLARQLQDRDDAVRRSARSSLLGQLSGGLCHHMRNAAAGAKLALQLYRRRASGDTAELDVALRQLNLSEEYLQRLLTLGKPQAPQPQEVDLREVVEETASLTAPAFKHRNIALRVECPATPVRAAAVDVDLLRQAIVNLLSNALDAVSDGGWVELKLAADGDDARITVADGGAGPPAHVAARLFEPFVTAKPDGVGLGLAATLRIAELHGGTVSFRRAPHTTFEILLPLKVREFGAAAMSSVTRLPSAHVASMPQGANS
jgi:signal transduction histidine kinase